MRKIETIWHYLLNTALEKKQYKHTQKDLAQLFKYSISTVNHALTAPASIGAVRKESKFFVLENFQKLLYYWASVRNLQKDIIYQTYYQGNVLSIEGLLPPESIYACYSAAKKILKEPPADYSKVYFYLAEKRINSLVKRFPKIQAGEANIFVLKEPPTMKNYGQITTLPQTFVDIWNLKDWYAQDFFQALEKKIYALLS